MVITNVNRHKTFGHNWVQPDWPNLTLPYIANFFTKPKLIDNSQRFSFKLLKEPTAISIRSEREYSIALNIIKQNKNIVLAGGQAANNHASELKEYNIEVLNIKEPADMDERPFPRWDLLPLVKSVYFKGRFTGSIEMSRGCPHNCSFCAVKAYWKTFEQKSNERILEELKFLKKQGRTHIYLTDDNFGVNVDKHMDLFGMIKSLDMMFFTQIRASTIARSPDMIKKAHEAGFYGFLIGFDTYESNIFKEEHKNSSSEINIKASECCRKNKIAVYGCHIYGLPSQKNPKDFEATFFEGRKRSDLFVMSFFNPMPGTKSAEKKIERGHIWHKEYSKYYTRHQFSFSEIIGTLFNSNPVIRRFKLGGYKKYFAYKF